MFKDISTFEVVFRFVFDNDALCAIKYQEHAIKKPDFLGEIAHKVLTWCVGEGYVVNPLLLKDIKEQVAVRLYASGVRLGTSKKPPSEDPERVMAGVKKEKWTFEAVYVILAAVIILGVLPFGCGIDLLR